jgi:RNA polymerase sigma-54 factor
MIKPTLVQKTSLHTVLTPQQIQYLRLLQQPIVELEQTVMQEIEINPFLEESRDGFDDELDEFEHDLYSPAPDQSEINDISTKENFIDRAYETDNYKDSDHNNSFDDDNLIYADDFTDRYKSTSLEENDSYDYYSYQWEDDGDFTPNSNNDYDNDYEPYQIKDNGSFYDSIREQLQLIELTDEEQIIAEQIIGNIDSDGYLRRSLYEILAESNSQIAEHNFNLQKQEYEKSNQKKDDGYNPAKNFEVSTQSIDTLRKALDTSPEIERKIREIGMYSEKLKKINNEERIFTPINFDTTEKVLKQIQKLEPVGIGCRDIRECLLAQLYSKTDTNEGQKLAILVLEEAFDEFSKKHFIQLQKKFSITEDQMRDAFDEIKKLNPKPGGDDFVAQTNTIIPDFIIRYDDDNDDLLVTLNDSTIPNVKVNQTYEKIKEEAKRNKKFNKESKEWMKERFENARFFIQALKQRNITMIMVMTAIAQRQKEFFMNDVKSIKPMIYKDISDDTSLDISTVCRIVNGKYVFTSIGTYELKFFFSEALPNDDGEGISTTVIKDKIKSIIGAEPKNKPFSDDKLAKLLKDEGYNVARRTIAKYRETLKIPVARLRKEL